MLYRGSIPQVTLRFFLICYVFLLIIALSYSYLGYRGKIREAEHRAGYVVESVSHHIESQYVLVERVLKDVAQQIALSAGDLRTVRATIDREINQKSFPMRVAWSNREKQLMVGTAIGLFTQNSRVDYHQAYRADLSERDYITQAQQRPEHIIVSGLLHHKITGRPFHAIALGVTDANGEYLGCLANIEDQKILASFMQGSLQGNVLWGGLYLPNGEALFSTFPPGSVYDPGTVYEDRVLQGGYRLVVAVNPGYRQSLLERHLIEALLIVLLLSLLFLVLHQLFAYRLARPIQEVLQLLFGMSPMGPAEKVPAIALHGLMPKIQHVQELVKDYENLQNRLHDRERKLFEAAELMQGIRQDYYGTLGSLSKELQEAFDAIQAYGELCKEASIASSDDAYQQHFEVEEFGLNMKFISNALYLLCKANYGELHLQPEELRIDAWVEESLAHCREVIADKTVDIRYHATHSRFYHDETVVRYLIDGLVFTVWRFMAYASKAEIQVGTGDEGISFCAVIQELEDVFLPKQEQDASLFIPSRRKSSAADIVWHLENHINIRMLRMLARLAGGTVTLEPQWQGMRLTLVMKKA